MVIYTFTSNPGYDKDDTSCPLKNMNGVSWNLIGAEIAFSFQPIIL
jgi:hypothetical protein